MVWIILGVVAISIALFLLQLVPYWVTLIAIFAVALFAAWWLDRGRSAGAAPPFRDENRPELYAPMANATWQVPTSYIDHPSGGGPPPGVEQYDQHGVEELIGERTSPRNDDPAP